MRKPLPPSMKRHRSRNRPAVALPLLDPDDCAQEVGRLLAEWDTDTASPLAVAAVGHTSIALPMLHPTRPPSWWEQVR